MKSKKKPDHSCLVPLKEALLKNGYTTNNQLCFMKSTIRWSDTITIHSKTSSIEIYYREHPAKEGWECYSVPITEESIRSLIERLAWRH